MRTHAILVVDDEPASLRAVARCLRESHEILTTESPHQALSIVLEQPVAVLLSDQRMAEMNGTELLSRVAALRPDIIRMLLTGYTDIDLLVSAINAGHVYAYIAKPWDPGALRLSVERAYERFEVEADRRRLLGELQESCARLQRESERQSRLIALAAHELRTPVHLLASALAFLREGVMAESPWLDDAVQATDWLARCVRQLHASMHWRGDAPVIRRQAVDIESLCGQLVAELACVAQRRHLRLSLRLVPPLPPLPCDRGGMRQALLALLTNAIRFTPDGGGIELGVVADEGCVEITVRDSGIGIAPDRCDYIFEPFSPAAGDVSLHTSGSFEFGARGLGLGLAIAKAIVEAHGGRLEVQSTPGRGSCFRARLPLEP